MTRRKTDESAPVASLETVVREWLYSLTPDEAAPLIAAELRARGIHTTADLAAAPVAVVQQALRAAYRADAHSLTGLAARFVKGEDDGNPEP